jgi:hypothetical protein
MVFDIAGSPCCGAEMEGRITTSPVRDPKGR